MEKTYVGYLLVSAINYVKMYDNFISFHFLGKSTDTDTDLL